MHRSRVRWLDRDSILMALSGTIIGFCLWPPGPAMQTVIYQSGDEPARQYCLTNDDPKLQSVRDYLQAKSKPVEPRSILVARWRRELAAFYASKANACRIAKSSTEIAQVAFHHDLESGSKTQTTRRWPVEADHWKRVRDQTDAWIKRAEMELVRQRQPNFSVRLGPTREGSRGLLGLLVAVSGGILLAVVFHVWSLVQPALTLEKVEARKPDPVSPVTAPSLVASGQWDRSGGEADSYLRIEIPATWVRVRQRPSVKLRRGCYGMVLCGASIAIIANLL